jgi:hypothetical protein
MEMNYNNGLFDAYRDRKQAELDMEASKLEILQDVANKPAKSNKALIIIPVVVLLIGGAIAIVMLKKKK